MGSIKVTKNDIIEFSVDREYVADKIKKVLEKWHLDVTVREEDFEKIIKECVEDL
jgi:ABC-type uncharacterized transport system ATPase subunit